MIHECGLVIPFDKPEGVLHRYIKLVTACPLQKKNDQKIEGTSSSACVPIDR